MGVTRGPHSHLPHLATVSSRARPHLEVLDVLVLGVDDLGHCDRFTSGRQPSMSQHRCRACVLAPCALPTHAPQAV